MNSDQGERFGSTSTQHIEGWVWSLCFCRFVTHSILTSSFCSPDSMLMRQMRADRSCWTVRALLTLEMAGLLRQNIIFSLRLPIWIARAVFPEGLQRLMKTVTHRVEWARVIPFSFYLAFLLQCPHRMPDRVVYFACIRYRWWRLPYEPLVGFLPAGFVAYSNWFGSNKLSWSLVIDLIS